MEIHRAALETEKNVDAIIKSIDVKMDKLVNHLVDKNQKNIPVNVFGWLVFFILVFNFTLIFGAAATERLGEKFGNMVGTHQEKKE